MDTQASEPSTQPEPDGPTTGSLHVNQGEADHLSGNGEPTAMETTFGGAAAGDTTPSLQTAPPGVGAEEEDEGTPQPKPSRKRTGSRKKRKVRMATWVWFCQPLCCVFFVVCVVCGVCVRVRVRVRVCVCWL